MEWNYECTECRRKHADPLVMRECRIGCGGIFCAGCRPEHETVCRKRLEEMIRDDGFLENIRVEPYLLADGYGWGV
jgi:hypothetical protein